ncbi:MAG: acyltransferase [Tannerellaceae bacterium]|jgi:hypothetical protein|nr:acyltransferase [Tannerellaceae bacterium]
MNSETPREPKFDDLRPYYDEEIPAAMRRIADSEYFSRLSAYIYPDREADEVRKMIRGYTTINEFQLQVMLAFNEQIVKRSIRSFTFEGVTALDRNQTYLFVSNHRDIMLDATLLQYALYISGHRTSEISFGSNLMRPSLVVDIGKSNKMYKTIRGGNMRDFYNSSLHLSEYIRHTLLVKNESVWIAQSNGRAKNGLDTTEPGIIRMFCMSRQDNFVNSLAELNIVPVSVSYQWETCDAMKARELCCRQRDGSYEKAPDEDLQSILAGIMQYKGDVHLHCGSPISVEDLASCAGLPSQAFNRHVATLIDGRIRSNYRLSCNNYIAHDILSDSGQYGEYYTPEEKDAFIDHYRRALDACDCDRELFAQIFLRIYANPIEVRAK